MRIVLPPRRDGQPLSSGSRETAMINLPPKPVQKPPESISTQPPSQVSPAIPKPPALSPAGGQPLTSPIPPKPPSIPGMVPPAPNPLGCGCGRGRVHRRLDRRGYQEACPSRSRQPSRTFRLLRRRPDRLHSQVRLRPRPDPPGSPYHRQRYRRPAQERRHRCAVGPPPPLSSEPKKETAKVPPSAAGARPLPQASVHLQKKPGGSVAAVPASRSASTNSAITVAPQVQAEPSSVGIGVGLLALLASVAAVAIQLWMILE